MAATFVSTSLLIAGSTVSPAADAQEGCSVERDATAHAAATDLTPAQATALYDCLKSQMGERYARAADPTAAAYQGWARFNTAPYVSATHGQRYVNNYGDGAAAEAYGEFEALAEFPVGGILAKDSFMVDETGTAQVGPLFLMEKMQAGFNADTGDWRYSLVTPNGDIMGVTGGQNSAGVQFCAACHLNTAEVDSMLFVPEAFRVDGGG